MTANLNPEFENFAKALQWYILKRENAAAQKTYGDNGSVICINGKWGAGKSTFLKFFEALIKDAQKNTIKDEGSGQERACALISYDAWENDYFNEPLSSLISQVFLTCPPSEALGKVTFSLINMIKALSLNLSIGCASVEISGEKLVDSVSKSSLYDDVFSEYKALHCLINDFKERLGNLKEESDSSKIIPLKIILIDELDRCIPIYALKILERVKHFFNAKNVVFIIACDKASLSESVKQVYGEIDAHHYLSRFFDIELDLPRLPDDVMVHNFRTIFPRLTHRLCKEQIVLYDLEPREQVKFLNLLNIISEKTKITRDELAILCALKVKSFEYFEKLSKFKCSVESAMDIPKNLLQYLEIVDPLKRLQDATEPSNSTADQLIDSRLNYKKKYSQSDDPRPDFEAMKSLVTLFFHLVIAYNQSEKKDVFSALKEFQEKTSNELLSAALTEIFSNRPNYPASFLKSVFNAIRYIRPYDQFNA